MDKIVYTKCSLERKNKYKVITCIVNSDGRLHVQKKAATKEAIDHVNHMYDYYRTAQSAKEGNLNLAECKLVEDGCVDFSYVSGDTIQAIMQQHYEIGNMDAVFDDFQSFYNVIVQSVSTEGFVETEEFKDVFGQFDTLNNRLAVSNANIDMLAENIFHMDDDYTIIDYEWVMPFAVPLDYILFRALYFNPVFQGMNVEGQDRILEMFHLERKDFPMFHDMELAFQHSISDLSLDELYIKMGQPVYFVDGSMKSNSLNHIEVVGTEGNKLYDIKTIHYDYKITVDVSKEQEVHVHPCEKRCVVKLKQVLLDGEDCSSSIADNAVLQIVDDYYFGEAPDITINTKDAKQLEVSFVIMEKDNGFLPNYAEALRDSHRYELEAMGLAKDKKVYQEAADSLREENVKLAEMVQSGKEESSRLHGELNNVREELNKSNEELTNIKSARGWRVFARINKL